MTPSFIASRADSNSTKVTAIALGIAAFLTLLFTHFDASLAPLRMLIMALTAFAIWAFCDEMGVKKPLNRAGFVLFAIALVARIQATIGLQAELAGRYYLLYAAFLMLAILFWSIAFLHRERTLKLVGAVGLLASLTPIAAILIGHLVVGVGTAIGLTSLLSATNGDAVTDLGFVRLAERIFGLWAYIAAWMLWRGHIRASGKLTA